MYVCHHFEILLLLSAVSCSLISFPLYNLNSLFIFCQMLIKSLSAILAVILEAFGVYCEGEFKWGCG